MAITALVVTLFAVSQAVKLPPPEAPHYKNADLLKLRDDIFSLSSDIISKKAAQKTPGVSPNVHPFIVPTPGIQQSLKSTPPRQFYHAVVDGVHYSDSLPTPLPPKINRRQNGGSLQLQQRSHSHQTPLADIKYKSKPLEEHVETPVQVKKLASVSDEKKSAATRQNKAGNGKDGGNYHNSGGQKGTNDNKKHYNEEAKHGDNKKEVGKKIYKEDSGIKKSYKDGDEYGGEKHSQSAAGHKASSKNAADHNKGHAAKGYQHVHHKDENKKHDSFYNNGHEEEKWTHYGNSNHKHGKENFKKKGGKWYKEGKSEDSQKKAKEDKKESGSKSAEAHESQASSGDKYHNEKTIASAHNNNGGKSFKIKQ